MLRRNFPVVRSSGLVLVLAAGAIFNPANADHTFNKCSLNCSVRNYQTRTTTWRCSVHHVVFTNYRNYRIHLKIFHRSTRGRSSRTSSVTVYVKPATSGCREVRPCYQPPPCNRWPTIICFRRKWICGAGILPANSGLSPSGISSGLAGWKPAPR